MESSNGTSDAAVAAGAALNYSKVAGDITIPTKRIFISTKCVQVIQDSCKWSCRGAGRYRKGEVLEEVS